jgi:hypothetical protein
MIRFLGWGRRDREPVGRGHDVGVLWMKCAGDGWEHAVTEACVARGRASGTYLACCHRWVRPGSLADAAGPRCPECALMLDVGA